MMTHKPVFHMAPAFAEFVGTIFTSGNPELAHGLVRAFMASEGGSLAKLAPSFPHPQAGNADHYVRHSHGRIFQPHCERQANAAKRMKSEARGLANG